MRAKKKLYATIVLVIFIVILLAGYILYIPPLLNGRGYNIPGRIYNFFAYAYYSSRMEWSRNGGEDHAQRLAAARAGWYNPSELKRLIGISPDNTYDLAEEYARLGMRREGLALFMKAFPGALGDEGRIEEIIAYQMILGDWAVAAVGTALWLDEHPASIPAAYWQGRSLLEDGEYLRSLPLLEKIRGDENYSSDAFYHAGRASEFLGRLAEAVVFQEEVTRTTPGHRGAWEALAGLYEKQGHEAAREKAQKRIDQLTPQNLCRAVFGNELVLLGYDLPESEIKPGEIMTLKLYLEGWRPGSIEVIPRLALHSEANPGLFSFQGGAAEIRTTGDVVRLELSWRLPREIYPWPV